MNFFSERLFHKSMLNMREMCPNILKPGSKYIEKHLEKKEFYAKV